MVDSLHFLNYLLDFDGLSQLFKDIGQFNSWSNLLTGAMFACVVVIPPPPLPPPPTTTIPN